MVPRAIQQRQILPPPPFPFLLVVCEINEIDFHRLKSVAWSECPWVLEDILDRYFSTININMTGWLMTRNIGAWCRRRHYEIKTPTELNEKKRRWRDERKKGKKSRKKNSLQLSLHTLIWLSSILCHLFYLNSTGYSVDLCFDSVKKKIHQRPYRHPLREGETQDLSHIVKRLKEEMEEELYPSFPASVFFFFWRGEVFKLL